MKQWLPGLLILLLAACGNETVYDEIPELEESSELHAIVVVEDQHDETNRPYYDALLDVKRSDMQTHIVEASDAPASVKHFGAESFPCLIVYQEGEIRLHLDSDEQPENILYELETEMTRLTEMTSESF
ncbi:hypothetical protein [Alkalicoccus urumqiensis]|uniref:Small peptidoglycan-associated lipoprotein n=1 Tax=Alkalicoccus urumqiensis TaxID=1548213 RepID=A0A2P6MIH8_ALKUR|nr:hypothetical protein [Alkalicoccus urumqiensis]PRO66068.1 hypothetical protein C6I21_07140 [Alkalicoccus urumqiensis]